MRVFRNVYFRGGERGSAGFIMQGPVACADLIGTWQSDDFFEMNIKSLANNHRYILPPCQRQQ